MANNYLDFSQVLPRLTDEEEQWLRRQLETVYIFGDKEYDEDAIPEELDVADADWHGCRAYRDTPECAQYAREMRLDGPGFGYSFDTDSDADGWGRHLWVHADEWGYLEGLAHVVQKFLRTFRPGEWWAMSYSNTCSKPRVGEFAGGAAFITAEEIRWEHSFDFIDQQAAAFQSRKGMTQPVAADPDDLTRHFQCPSCTGGEIEEVLAGTCVATLVECVTPDGELEYGEQSISGGVTDRYQCRNCGYTIAHNAEGLVAALTAMGKTETRKRRRK